MSKALFRIDVTKEQTELLFELLTRAAVNGPKALSLGGLWTQVYKATKHYGIETVPAPIVPPPMNTAA